MRAVEEKILPLHKVAEMLEKRQKEGTALSYEQQNTLEYAQKFSSSLSESNYKELKADLEKLGLTQKQAVKVCDLLPRKEDEVKIILLQETPDASDERAKEVVAAVKKYRK